MAAQLIICGANLWKLFQNRHILYYCQSLGLTTPVLLLSHEVYVVNSDILLSDWLLMGQIKAWASWMKASLLTGQVLPRR